MPALPGFNHPSRTTRKVNLSPPRRRLVALMQELHFGEIHGLRIVDGDPLFDPFPEVARDIVLSKEDRPHPARGISDFALKAEVVNLYELFDREQTITIDRLIVQAGLPLRLRVRVRDQE
jgi:hypothetical protein